MDSTDRLDRATPDELGAHDFASGSMAPKVEAACAFVRETGGRAGIGSLAARSTEAYPEYYPNSGLAVQLQSFQDSIVGPVKTPLFILLAAATPLSPAAQ